MSPRPVAFLFLAALAALPSFAAEIPPPWAYGFKTPPPTTLPPSPPAVPAAPAAKPSLVLRSLPDTIRQFTVKEVTEVFGPADWYPDDHPPAPEIVSHGRAPAIWACARCHYVNGKGRPENAGIAGLPVDYFIGQLHAFRDGERTSSDPRKPNTKLMADYAKAMTEDEIRAAAEYYGSMAWTPWIRVVETERVPQTTTSVGMYLPLPDLPDEPIGDRIIEVPEDVEQVEVLRSPRVGFIAYVPPGSVKAGEVLVTTGGGKTAACTACHGSDLQGFTSPATGTAPGIAGRSPSYLVRQLFDLKTGARHGKRTEPMKPVVANLSTNDMLAIAAYLASRE